MAFRVEEFNLQNRQEVEKLAKAVEAWWRKIKEKQPTIASTHPLWNVRVPASIGEIMRLNRDQIYQNEDWKILKDREFYAYALSREVYGVTKPRSYPVLLVAPLDWSATDLIDAFEAYIQKWLREGYTKVWLRLPINVNILDQLRIPKLTHNLLMRYPGPEWKAPFPPMWDVYEMEVQE